MIDSLTQFAAEQQRLFNAATSLRMRKERGHFGTAPAIADFMAELLSQIPPGPVRILDPGAGVGTLSAAVCQRVLQQCNPHHLVFELWENDPRLEPYLRTTLKKCQRALKGAGHEMQFTIQAGDFVLEHANPSLFGQAPAASFDLAIMNPPYFKIRRDAECARAMAHVVHGQPNIYVLFLAVAAGLLRDEGRLVAITPRSYFSGPYFRRFRSWFFDRMTARRIHVFESRADAFQEDEVLQENVILLAEKGGEPSEIVLTSSPGRNFHDISQRTLPYTQVVENSSGNRLVRVPANGFDQQIIEAVDNLPHRFRELPFKISTGPVVTFRSRAILRLERSVETAPLLWMHNVQPFTTRFPPKNGKPTHILVNDESKRILVSANRYVLLKRFTAKEERRRLVAGIVEAQDSYSPFLGLENHLNYVYRPEGELAKDESLGLAALFNSVLIERYFRAISGNTQVNATEIRVMPVPCVATIRAIGQAIETSGDTSAPAIERVVGAALSLPESLITELAEASR